jgi:flagellar FliL protein
MSKPAKPAAKKDAAPAADGAAPKSKKKLIMIVVAAVVLLGGGAGAFFFMKSKSPPAGDAKKVEVAKDPRFISLEAFTGNLQREVNPQYDPAIKDFQITISLKVMEPEMEEKIKTIMPEIRSKLILLLSSKRPSELDSIVGKKKLAIDIATETNALLGIHNAPQTVAGEPAAAKAAPAIAEGASSVAAAPAEGASSAPAEATPAVPAAPAEAVASDAPPEAAGGERKGVVDVLFTSFIIQ